MKNYTACGEQGTIGGIKYISYKEWESIWLRSYMSPDVSAFHGVLPHHPLHCSDLYHWLQGNCRNKRRYNVNRSHACNDVRNLTEH